MVETINFVPITPIPTNIGDLKTAVFVDYESWFWGLYNKYGETPDLNTFITEIKKRGRIDKISFFGDFSKPEMENEITKIKTITNDIINCKGTERESKKEYTDFIMLDHIYRTIDSRPDIEQYCFITGDGHFHSVAAFLRTFKDKLCGVYGVKGSISTQLISCASWAIEIRPKYGSQNGYRSKILQTLRWAERNRIEPSFRKSVEVASKHYRGESVKFAAALSKLIEEGYIQQEEKTISNGNTIRILKPKWDLINKHNLIDEDND